MIFLQSNGLPKEKYTKTFTATTSMTPEEEIKHCERGIQIYFESFMITNWWNIFKIRHIQKMIKSYQDRLKQLKK